MNDDVFELRVWRRNGNEQAFTFASFPAALRALADRLDEPETLKCSLWDYMEEQQVLFVEV